MDKSVENTRKIMEELGVDGEIIEHLDTNGTRSEVIAKALDVPLENIIKCLILKSKDGSLAAAVILGNQKLDVKKVESILRKKKLSLASPESVQKATGYSIGGVPPFAVINRFPLCVDSEVLKKSYVIGSAGTPYYGLKFDPTIFKRFNVRIDDISIS